MKIYVGGRYHDFLEIRKIQEYVKSLGHNITYDWTQLAENVIEKRKDPNNSDENMLPEDLHKKLITDAVLDLQGVYSADFSIFYMNDPDYIYRGTFFELGASLSRDLYRNVKRTIIISTPGQQSFAKTLCFFHHPNIIHVEKMEDIRSWMAPY
jgi:hypothetical protein